MAISSSEIVSILFTWVCLYAITGLGAMAVGLGDSCYLQFIVPKESIKNSCNVEENMIKRLKSLEGRLLHHRTLINILEETITKIKTRMIRSNKARQRDSVTGNMINKPRAKAKKQAAALAQGILSMFTKQVRGRSLDSDDNWLDYDDDYYNITSDEFEDNTSPFLPLVNIVPMEMVRPYVDQEIKKMREEIEKDLEEQLSPVTTSFQEVREMLLKPESEYVATFPGEWSDKSLTSVGQLTTNTAMLSRVLKNMVHTQERLDNLESKQQVDALEMSFLRENLTRAAELASDEKHQLELRVRDLEEENRLLRLNSTYTSEISNIRVSVAEELSKIKDEASKHEFDNTVARSAPWPSHEDNEIKDEQYTLAENKMLQELRRNVTDISAQISKGELKLDNIGTAGNLVNLSLQNLRNTTVHNTGAIIDIQSKVYHIEKSIETLPVNYSSMSSRVDALDVVTNDLRIKAEEDKKKRFERSDVFYNITDRLTKKLDQLELNVKTQNLSIHEHISTLQDSLTLHIEQAKNNLSGVQTSLRNELDACTKLNENLTTREQQLAQEIQYLIGNLSTRVDKLNGTATTLNKSAILFHNRTDWTIDRIVIKLRAASDTIKNVSKQFDVIQTNLFDFKSTSIKNVSLLYKSIHRLGVAIRLDKINWIKFDFGHANGRSECSGSHYVKLSNYKSAPLVGVALCNKDRYKIYLGQSLDTSFLIMADSAGLGRDHCEFVGGRSEMSATTGDPDIFFKPVLGYTRHTWGQEPKQLTLSLVHASPQWYECGVQIP